MSAPPDCRQRGRGGHRDHTGEQIHPPTPNRGLPTLLPNAIRAAREFGQQPSSAVTGQLREEAVGFTESITWHLANETTPWPPPSARYRSASGNRRACSSVQTVDKENQPLIKLNGWERGRGDKVERSRKWGWMKLTDKEGNREKKCPPDSEPAVQMGGRRCH